MKLQLLIVGFIFIGCLAGCSGGEPSSPPAEEMAAKMNEDQKKLPPLNPAAQAVRDKAIAAGAKAPTSK